MKVLQVNVVYAKGSTGKIAQVLHRNLLARGFESVVCYGRGEKTDDPCVVKTCGEAYSKMNNLLSRITGIMYGGCYLSTSKLIREIKKHAPDVVHLQCINGYFVNIYRLVKWLKKQKIKTVVTLHAEFMFTGGCGYAIDCDQWRSPQGCGLAMCPRWRAETKSWFCDRTETMWRRMKAAFDGFDEGIVVTSVSPWLMERAKHSPILGDKEHRVVMNGLDENVFYPRNSDRLRERFALGEKKIIFHATASFTDSPLDLKGGYHLIEIAKRMPEWAFVVAGPSVVEQELPSNVYLLGRIEDQEELAQHYSEADLTILLSSRETFSMVTAESLCCGTPVVGFRAGGPESIAVAEYSAFVEYGNYEQLILAMKEKMSTAIDSEKCIERYAQRKMTDRYIEVYHDLIEQK